MQKKIISAIISRANPLTLSETRFLFDNLIQKFPVMKNHLAPDSTVVACKDFENGIVKFLDENEENNV